MVKVEEKTISKDGRELQGIDLTVSVQPDNDIESQFGLMVDRLYQWYSKHGNACGECTIGFVADDKHQEALMTCLLGLIQQEEPLRPLFAQLGEVDVTCFSPDGKVTKESALKIG
jgi:hypothetical protein